MGGFKEQVQVFSDSRIPITSPLNFDSPSIDFLRGFNSTHIIMELGGMGAEWAGMGAE